MTAPLLSYVSSDGVASSADEALAEECWGAAVHLVARYLGPGAVVVRGEDGFDLVAGVAPEAVLKQACLLVGAELFHRRSARNGISQFASPDAGGGIRIARDPMVAAYPVLAPYAGRGIAGGYASAALALDGGTA